MILFPAIDLIGGKVVRLERGDRSRCKVYSDDPVAVARSFAEQGASWVHVVDLSAAFGEDENTCAANSAAIKAICGVDGLSVDVGGGVRSLARIDELAGYGARRIALGTVLVTEPGFAEVAAQGFGELLVADIAAHGHPPPMLRTRRAGSPAAGMRAIADNPPVCPGHSWPILLGSVAYWSGLPCPPTWTWQGSRLGPGFAMPVARTNIANITQ